MRHLFIVSMVTVALLAAAIPATLSAQAAEPAPKLGDGHPDLSGVWWTGGDVGGRGYNSSRAGGSGGGRGAAPPQTFTGLYNQAAKDAAKNLSDKDDPTLHCTPTAFGTLNVSMFDVGAVAQIVATSKFVVMMTETYHSYKAIP